MKRKWFTDIPNLTILAPSEWIKDIVKESFLKGRRIEVVHNGIELKVFYPQNDESVWKKYNIPSDRKILLGVANIWDKRKGLDDFLLLARILPDEYHIVLVGLTKRQMKKLPGNMTGIERTSDITELVKIYSGASIFINPSLEESFSLVTVEAMACGTPAIVLDTSAVKELVDEKSGLVLKQHQPQDYIKAIQLIMDKKLRTDDIRARAEKFDKDRQVARIIELYKTV